MRYFCKYFMLFSMLIIANVAHPQSAYYSDDYSSFKLIKNATIEAQNNSICIQLDTNFVQPITIICFSNSDTISVQKIKNLAFFIDVTSITNVKILSSNKKELLININYNNSILSTIDIKDTCALIIILALIITIIILHKHLKKHIELNKEVDIPQERRTQKFDCATILFADIQGFTKIAEHMNPEQLVDELDRYFIFFDELVEKYNVEKIKTIGDAYMCAGGVPNSDSANPIEVTLVGLEMIAYVKNRQATAQGFWNIRVGINTGPVISGSLGFKKKSFDIWGDSVNTASRMESSSIPGEINITDNTYQKIKDFFECEHRGKMPVKYKGDIDMYFVKRLKPEFAENGSAHIPNKLLIQKIRLLKISDLQNQIEKEINKNNSNLIQYYNIYCQQIDKLCAAEKLNNEDTLSCKATSLITFINIKIPYIYNSIIRNSTQLLRKIQFPEDQIDTINLSINKLSSGKRPSTIIEEIITDALHEYLGREDYIEIMKKLYECQISQDIKTSKQEWIREQKKLLSTNIFYTTSAKQSVKVSNQEQIKQLEQIIRIWR